MGAQGLIVFWTNKWITGSETLEQKQQSRQASLQKCLSSCAVRVHLSVQKQPWVHSWQETTHFYAIQQGPMLIASIKFPSLQVFYLLQPILFSFFLANCGTWTGLIFRAAAQWRLRGGIRPGKEGAISPTKKFPSPPHIRNLAPRGRQILLLACERRYIIHRYLCAFWGRTCFFATEQNHMFWHFSRYPSLAPKISQSSRCFELASMVANTSHAKHG